MNLLMFYMINLIMPIDRSYITFYASNNNSTNRSDGFNASSLSSIKSIFFISLITTPYIKNTLGANLM